MLMTISSKNIYNSKSEIIWLFLFVAVTCFYLALAIQANSDLLDGRFVLFMDERITFDGVNNILHPEGIKHFFWSILDGNDHRYGRSLWNTIAIFSFIPELIFGEAGQILAGRMTQVVILVSAFILLSVTFVKHWALRFFLLTSLLALPYTSYYMTMPKPEPLQILFVALFLYFFNKKTMELGKRYWIFLGLAFGAKISTLPLAGIFILIASLQYFPNPDAQELSAKLSKTLLYFFVGLGVSVPILLPVIFATYLSFKVGNKISAKIHINKLVAIFVCFLIFNVIAKGITYITITKSGMGIWLSQTFGNSKHGTDLNSIGFGSWVDFFFSNWLIAPKEVTILLSVSCITLSIIFLTQSLKEKHLRQRFIQSTPLILIVGGGMLNLLIFVAVHRLWGFYLFPGMVLIIVGIFSVVERFTIIDNSIVGSYIKLKRVPSYYLSLLVLLLILVVTFNWWLPNSVTSYENLSLRSESKEYKKNYSAYLKITELLDYYGKNKKNQLIVLYDPVLFPVKSNNSYKIIPFWGPHANWKYSPDIIIFSEIHTLKNDLSQHTKSPNYKSMLIERSSYEKYVIREGESCLYEKCYQRLIELPNGGEILILVKPHQKL